MRMEQLLIRLVFNRRKEYWLWCTYNSTCWQRSFTDCQQRSVMSLGWNCALYCVTVLNRIAAFQREVNWVLKYKYCKIEFVEGYTVLITVPSYFRSHRALSADHNVPMVWILCSSQIQKCHKYHRYHSHRLHSEDTWCIQCWGGFHHRERCFAFMRSLATFDWVLAEGPKCLGYIVILIQWQDCCV